MVLQTIQLQGKTKIVGASGGTATVTDGKLDVNATVNATITGSAIEDGVSSSIKATVKDLTNSNPLTTAIVDANGDQITSFGGGTQYTEGDTDASITGTAVMWEDTSDTLRAVSHAKPLPVHVTTAENGVVSTVNSSTATLTANSTFTGTSEEVLDVSTIIVNVKASHASATDGLVIEFSPDGTNWDNSDKYTIPAAIGKTFTAQPAGKYIRVRYTNGGTNQTYFRLETILKYVATKSSSHRIQDTLSDDDDGELGISVIKLRTAQDDYVSGAATAGGNFKVSIEEVNGTTDFATETTLSALNAKVTAVNTGAVVVSSSALPSGAATSAKQDTIIGYVDGLEGILTTIDSDTGTLAGAVSGTEMQVDVVTMPAITGTVTANAGTNLNTSALALETGGNLASIKTNTDKIPSQGQALMAASTPVVIASNQSAVPITDNSGSLTVDAPVATPVFVRLSDGASAITTLPVSLASVPSHPVTNAGTFAVQETTYSTSSVTSVAASATSVQLLASTSGRRGAYFYNDSSAICYLKLGTTASTSSFTIAMATNSFYELPYPCYTGRIDAIWVSATGNMRITEIT